MEHSDDQIAKGAVSAEEALDKESLIHVLDRKLAEKSISYLKHFVIVFFQKWQPLAQRPNEQWQRLSSCAIEL